MNSADENAENFDAIFGDMYGQRRYRQRFPTAAPRSSAPILPALPPVANPFLRPAPDNSETKPESPLFSWNPWLKQSAQPEADEPVAPVLPEPVLTGMAAVPGIRIFSPTPQDEAVEQVEEEVAEPVAEEPPAELEATEPEPEPAELEPPAILEAAEPEVLKLFIALDGEPRREIHGDVVLGRRPSAEGCASISVSDVERTVSKTHVKLAPTASGMFVTDLGSTNGTLLVSPTGATSRLEPQTPTLAPAGSSVKIGSRTIVISH